MESSSGSSSGGGGGGVAEVPTGGEVSNQVEALVAAIERRAGELEVATQEVATLATNATSAMKEALKAVVSAAEANKMGTLLDLQRLDSNKEAVKYFLNIVSVKEFTHLDCIKVFNNLHVIPAYETILQADAKSIPPELIEKFTEWFHTNIAPKSASKVTSPKVVEQQTTPVVTTPTKKVVATPVATPVANDGSDTDDDVVVKKRSAPTPPSTKRKRMKEASSEDEDDGSVKSGASSPSPTKGPVVVEDDDDESVASQKKPTGKRGKQIQTMSAEKLTGGNYNAYNRLALLGVATSLSTAFFEVSSGLKMRDIKPSMRFVDKCIPKNALAPLKTVLDDTDKTEAFTTIVNFMVVSVVLPLLVELVDKHPGTFDTLFPSYQRVRTKVNPLKYLGKKVGSLATRTVLNRKNGPAVNVLELVTVAGTLTADKKAFDTLVAVAETLRIRLPKLTSGFAACEFFKQFGEKKATSHSILVEFGKLIDRG